MNLYSRLFLINCLLTSIMYGQQRFFLSDPDLIESPNLIRMVVKDSEDLNLEHSFFDYQHYYGHECRRACGMDWQVAPFYTHLKTINPDDAPATDSRATTQIGGAQFQVQLNFRNYYFRANTAIGKIKNTFANKTIAEADLKTYEFSGVDDITAKLGRDWFFCKDDHHIGLFVLGGFPGNAEAVPVVDNYYDRSSLNSTKFGIGSFRAGLGLNSAFTLSHCGDKHLTWHSEIQYAYAFLHTVSTSIYTDTTTGKPQTTYNKYTPGQFVSAWTAFHYAMCAWGIELGSMFETAFGEKNTSVQYYTDFTGTVKQTINFKQGYNIAFTAKPYVGVSYEATLCKNPLNLGLGIGYEYDKMHTGLFVNDEIEQAYDAFQGVNVWGNITYSF